MTKNDQRPSEKDIFTVKRFQQFMWALLFLTIFNLLNIYLGDSESKPISFTVILTVAAIMLYSFRLIKTGQEDFARSMVLTALVLSIVYMTWLNGGIGDTTMMSYPILVVYTILIGGVRVFLPVVSFLVLSIVLMGANSIYGWYPNPVAPTDWEQVFDAIMITLIAAYGAWTVNSDLHDTLIRLNDENHKVVQSRETIQLIVERDSLTGLFNRPACDSHYNTLLDNLSSTPDKIAVFFIDLDDFKSVNDSFGHNTGDELLIAIAAELKSLIASTDIACRLGGDEFVMIIKRDASFDINDFADSILKAMSKPIIINDTTVRLTGSIGIAIKEDENADFDEILTKADIAMYKSKQLGKNIFSYYTAQLHEETLNKSAIVSGLKTAIEQGLLDLHLQPKINLSTGKVESAEALLRWNRGNPNHFTPGDFIPVIESTELIHEIGQWCLEEACRICRRWHDAGFSDMSIAVNVSSVQFMRSNFTGIVSKALEESGLAPEFLEIELTEHVLIQHNDIIVSQLKALKEIGIYLSIDDFGTGYSNLSYLINFKVDSIKLDRSFIAKINTSSEHYAVVNAMIEMAHILNLQVVAEGVETDDVRLALIDLKCDYGQGYLWAKAVAESEYLSEVSRINSSMNSSMQRFG
ncbi:putative bifunctional diguanylate cyclase/phosphodiesterase [Leucothrix pacifica]|uniref:GGDEF-domain containing protein n=1 Tax=Leucothrix pacifica TaxID=1247513 RepID=A0A317CD69_9GAMM|nr:bifunctional diguanylate cyclase/phosphodiesterase [Leucothrix pacifica]PWQ96051.1 hypothetical protein DKW60_13440 [Leucothrix pacifica]